ncbi:MFS transporter [Paraburkholderia sp.]|uniref:MFS transporter n=1 Tax=Paraburkholderia sp. TaxID=1926495 RepID=UPI0023969591|nr:MFS transporter [Paraburkholderia sp.]MDE1182207.1 MFS transporter [Paraburkholderia sp.]
MSTAPSASSPSSPSAPTGLLERIGMPRSLLFGFIGLLLFMIGDGVEAGYLAPFLSSHGVSNAKIALLFTIYGVAVSIASWLSGALSDLWGPRRVMAIGLAIWAVFEVVFLRFGVAPQSYTVMVIAYAVRGLGHPLFAFGFLVWIAAATPPRQLGSAVGWFWFAFAAGLPTLGSLFASIAIPVIGQLATFWASLGLVIAGGLIALLCCRDKSGDRPPAQPDTNPVSVLFSSVSIIWREPKIMMAGVTRAINTSSEYAFLVIMPAFFTKTIGFTLEQWLHLLSIVFLSNIVFNLASGMAADKVGYRRVIGFAGCVGTAISVPLFYYMPLMFKGDFTVAAIFGAFYGATLACYVPLSGLVPQICPKEKAAALSVLGLGAGASVWLGPIIVTLFESTVGIAGVIWIFCGMYLVSGILTRFLTVSDEARAVSKAQAESGEEGAFSLSH